MKRVGLLLSFIVFLLLPAIVPARVYAECSEDRGSRQYSVQATLSGTQVIINGKPFHVPESQCKPPGRKPDRSYTLWCDNESEALARDSVVAYLCGASQELGKTNSTCWVCGGDLKCSGLSFAVGNTDTVLKKPDGDDPILGGSREEPQIWRVNPPPQSFEFNGQQYELSKYQSGGVVVCNSNVIGCGDEQGICKNYWFPEVKTGGLESTTAYCAIQPPEMSYSFASDEDVSCPSGRVNDSAAFVAPCADSTEQSSTCDISASSFPADGSWYQNAVNNKTYGYTASDGNRYVVQKSNDKHLLYRVDGDAIKLVEDTTWANAMRCQTIGSKALQRAYSPSGESGANFVSRQMSCGSGTNTTSYNEAHVWIATDVPLDPLSIACPGSQTQGNFARPRGTGPPVGGGNKLIYHGPARCGSWEGNVIGVQNTPGFGEKEVFFYCQGKGLCAWYAGIDFTKENNKPINWTANTDVCAGFTPIPEACKVPPNVVGEGDLPNLISHAIAIGDMVVGVEKNVLRDIYGLVFPDKQRQPVDSIIQEAAQFDGAWRYLAPNSTQRRERQLQAGVPFSVTVNGKICTPDSENEKKEFTPTGIWTTFYPMWNRFVEDGFKFVAMMGRGRLGNYNFRQWLPPQEVDENSPPPCSQLDEGTETPINNLTNLDEHEWAVPKEEGALYTAEKTVGSVLAQILDFIDQGICLLSKGCNATGERPALYKFGITIPYSNETDTNITSEERGVTRSYLPLSISNQITEDHSEHEVLVANAPHVGTNPEPFPAQLPKPHLAGIKKHMAALNCAIAPISKQASDINCQDFIVSGQTTFPTTAPQACEQYFTSGKKPGTPGSSAGGSLGYSIDYGDTSCSITDAGAAAIAQKLPQWYQAGSRSKFTSEWQTVQENAIKYGWNPAFVIALWIEESAAGGTGTHALGCLARNPSQEGQTATRLPADSPICEQLACTFEKSQSSFQNFMCRYAGRPLECTDFNFDGNECFPININYIYNLVVSTGGVKSSCAASTSVNATQLQSCCATHPEHPYCN